MMGLPFVTIFLDKNRVATVLTSRAPFKARA